MATAVPTNGEKPIATTSPEGNGKMADDGTKKQTPKAKDTPKPSRLKALWAKTGLDTVTLLLMAK